MYRSSPRNANSAALGASLVISESPCVLSSLNVLNSDDSSGAEPLFLQLFDAAALPADGTLVNGDIWQVYPGAVATIDYGAQGKRFTKGCMAVLSSTGATKTAAGNIGLFFARYYPKNESDS